MIIAFDSIVGSIFKKKLSTLMNLMQSRPIKVARVPNTASIIPLKSRFDKKQPIEIDIIAISSKIGKIQSASAILT